MLGGGTWRRRRAALGPPRAARPPPSQVASTSPHGLTKTRAAAVGAVLSRGHDPPGFPALVVAASAAAVVALLPTAGDPPGFSALVVAGSAAAVGDHGSERLHGLGAGHADGPRLGKVKRLDRRRRRASARAAGGVVRGTAASGMICGLGDPRLGAGGCSPQPAPEEADTEL